MSVTQFVVHGTTPQGNYWANVLHYLNDDGGSSVGITKAEEFTNAWVTAMATVYASVLPTDVQIRGYSCKTVGGSGGPTWTQAANFPGTRSGVCQAAGVCPDVAIFPGVAPWKIGHIYLAGVSTTDLSEGNYTGGFYTVISSFLSTLLLTVNTAGGDQCEFAIYNRTTDVATIAIDGLLKPKPTLMNRRLRPVTT